MDFVVEKRNLSQYSVLPSPPLTLDDGQILARVESFALTSNNITYAAAGDSMNYWDFYPHQDPAQGRIPVWGFASVIDSRSSAVAIGERFYGYLPMSGLVILQPSKTSQKGFVHRRAQLAAAYNWYSFCKTDPFHMPLQEELLPVLRPLYLTSWLLDDFLNDNHMFGASHVLITSASSKTAYGLAHTLRNCGRSVQILGLTSERNLAFVQRLGLYDSVVTYSSATSVLDASKTVALVDMAGNAATIAALHNHYGSNMKHSCLVGATHREAATAALPSELPGATPQFFFAPSRISKRSKEWGADGLQHRMCEAWKGFVEQVQLEAWCVPVQVNGPAAVAALYLDLLDGKALPSLGYVCSMHDVEEEEPPMLDGRALLKQARNQSKL